MIARYRQFPFRDPQLPAALTPEPWPGRAAYQLFRDAHEALGPATRLYVGEVFGHEVTDAELADV